jgi:release factor glutamine methyltransferase
MVERGLATGDSRPAVDEAMSIRLLLDAGREKLAPDPLARLESELLLCHALGVSRSFLFANPEFAVPLKRRSDYLALLRRRSEGEPIAYLVGKRSFWTFDLEVTSDVLIPRAETELLVEAALEVIPTSRPCRIADLGTGSGAIALAVASERPTAEVHATDLSVKALDLARKNAASLNLHHVKFHQGHWLQPLEGQFSVLVSNPPYVDESDPHLLEGDCRHEPRMALTPGADGMAAIREITRNAPDYLAPEGWLMVEHGHKQGQEVRDLFSAAGFDDVRTLPDLAGIERVCVGKWNA